MTKLFDIDSLPKRGGYRRSRWIELFKKSEQEIPPGKCREFTKSMSEVANAYYCLQRNQTKRGRFTDIKIYKVGNRGFIGKVSR